MKQPNNRPQKILGVWAAAISLAGALQAQPAGLWNFDSGDLSATVGSALQHTGSGASTSFGTTTSFTIPDIGGTPANVMKFDAGASGGGYRMPVAVAANGGGTFVNNYTVVIDVLFPTASATVRRPLLETDLGLVNTTEGAEFYVSDAGELSGLGNARGTIAADTWYRIGIVVDGANNQSRLYINGVEQGSFPAGGLDGRLALNPVGSSDPFAELFKDLAGATALGYVNSVQFRGEALTKGQMQALAGPTAGGIPATIPDIPSFVERWTPSEAFARLTSGLGVVINPGSSTLSNFAMTLNGNPLTLANANPTPDGDGNFVLTATGASLTALTDNTLGVTYTDSKDGNKSFTHDFYVPLLYEDFELVTLGSPVEEPGPLPNPIFTDNAFTHTAPDGWNVDRTGVPGYNNPPETNGRAEWIGWSFASKEFWLASDTQGREGFAKGRGNLAIADPDEWDDAPHPGSGIPTADRTLQGLWFKTFMTTPQISLTGAGAGTVFLRFDSSWNPEYDDDYRQTGRVRYRFDGGAWQDLFIWESLNTSPNYKPEAINETVSIPLNNPQGATSLQVEFGMYDAGNDWWWAVDNIVVDAGAIPPSITTQPQLTTVTVGGNAAFAVVVDPGASAPISYQWYKGTGGSRAPLDLETGASLTITGADFNDADFYSVDVTNPGGTLASAEAPLIVLPVATPSGQVAGQWDFDNGDYSATVGGPIVLLDGPGGATATGTTFGTTTGLGLPAIDGQVANVMGFPELNGAVGYIAAVGGSNGGEGATKKNVYTLVFDILWPTAANSAWRTFVQIDSLNNANDAEFFINTGNAIGVGTTGYHGQFTANEWQRIVMVVNQSAAVNRVRYFRNGQFIGSGSAGGFNGRFGLLPAMNLFSDNDGDTRAGYVNSVQVRNEAITDLEALALGGPKASGVPLVIDTSALPPLIATQPASVVRSSGQSLTLSVVAQSGLPVTYQWYRNGGLITGATDATYYLPTAITADAGDYTVVVSNANDDVTSAVATVRMPAITDDLVVHLTFDNDLTDSSGRGNNASTGAGSTPLGAGLIGQAVNVSTTIAGGRNYVTLGAPADLNFGTSTDFSVSFWVNSPGRSSDPGFIGNKDWDSGSNPGWILFASGNKLGMNIAPNRVDRGGAAEDPTIIGTGWHHVAAVFDRDGLFSAYVDGVLLGTANLGAASRDVNTPANFATNIGEDGTGAYNDTVDGSPGFAQGTLIDDVGIWRRQLTSAEVAAIHRGGLAGQSLQLVSGETLGTILSGVTGGNSLQFDWRGQPGARLQRNTDVANPAGWQDVPSTDGQDTIVLPINPALNEFFRLLRPAQP